jgi:hypothetical protein
LAFALLAGCGGSTPIGAPRSTIDAGDAPPNHQTFNYTGAEQSFKVPASVRSIHVDVRGGAGAGDYSSDYGGRGGRGGRVMATIPVQPGHTLYVFVGGEGSNDKGGFNGGGDGGSGLDCYYGWGGGGASDVRENGDVLGDRVLVAGGGGGLGSNFNGYKPAGGVGGGQKGGDGNGQASGGGGGGGAGTQKKGGAGGSPGGPFHPGHHGKSGAPGMGGSGGLCGHTHYAGGSGGGGGGGYFGGGGGGGGAYLSAGGGAGGGSGYVEPAAIKSRMWRGWKTSNGNGLVVFSWQ